MTGALFQYSGQIGAFVFAAVVALLTTAIPLGFFNYIHRI